MSRLWTIGFDADDTLWHNERGFRLTQDRFAEMLADHAERDHLSAKLLAAERRNLALYGFGVKGFILSMIETAIEVTDGTVPTHVIQDLLALGREMLAEPVELLPDVRACLETLRPVAEIILITKGDLLDQERKLAQSGLGDFFDGVEIVSEKTPEVYAEIFSRHAEGADSALMVGNSMRSDVVPVVQAGGWGVYVPHGLVWEIEHAPAPDTSARYREIPDLGSLPKLVQDIEGS